MNFRKSWLDPMNYHAFYFLGLVNTSRMFFCQVEFYKGGKKFPSKLVELVTPNFPIEVS